MINSKIFKVSFLLPLFLCVFGRTDIHSQNEGTILRLIVTDDNNNIKRGTGFTVVGYNYIITAYHVVQNAKRIDIDRPSSLKSEVLEIIDVSPEKDIAFLKIPISIVSKVVPFNLKRELTNASTKAITIFGYGSVIDRPQKYSGYHENAPYVLSGEWRKPSFIKSNSVYLFNISDVKLMMLQAPIPYGISGAPVINNEGKVIGFISGALTRIENVTSLGWAIPIEYALQNFPSKGIKVYNYSWASLKLITDNDIYLRAFGGRMHNLIDNLYCPECINQIHKAWEETVDAIAVFQGYLASAKVSVDVVTRQAKSRKEANLILSTQMELLKERFEVLKNNASAYRQKIISATVNCNRDLNGLKIAIEKLPKTDYNNQIEDGTQKLLTEFINDVNSKTSKDFEKAEYELQKQWSFITSIKPLSDKGSSFLSRPSKSIESDIHIFTQYIEAFEKIMNSVYEGTYQEINLNIESTLNSYLLLIESINRQPWDQD